MVVFYTPFGIFNQFWNIMSNSLYYIVYVILFITVLPGCARRQHQSLSDNDTIKKDASAVWTVSEVKTDSFPCSSEHFVPRVYRVVQLDTSTVFLKLRQSVDMTDSITIELVQLDGMLAKAVLARSASIPIELANRHGIVALSGRLKDTNGSLVRLELDFKGLRYMIISTEGTCIFSKLCSDLYLLYDKKYLPEGSKSDFE